MSRKPILPLLLLLLGASLSQIGLQEKEITSKLIFSEFEAFRSTHGKEYRSQEEEEERRAIFEQNYRRIVEHNSKNQDVELAINKFGDLTDQEFEALLKKNTPTSVQKSRSLRTSSLRAPPANVTIDWVKKGAVNPVKDQGMCGSCWAFSTVSALEGLYAIKNKKLASFSEQELVDCATKEYDNYGCNGGDPGRTFEYVEKYGIASEEDYPYLAYDSICRRKGMKSAFNITSHVTLKSGDTASILSALQVQPLSIYISAGEFKFRFYKRGIIKEGCGTGLGHCVNLVGALEENGVPYWLIRNSWGPDWGDDGYLKVLRPTSKELDPGVCGVAMIVSYPLWNSK